MRRTAPTSSRRALLALLALLAAGACTAPPEPPDPAQARAEITDMLQASADAWTRGDLDAFLDDYAPDATFVTSSGLVHGRAEIRQRYQSAYWREGRPRDGLRYDGLDIRLTGPRSAVAFGHFILYDRDTGDPTSTGIFSLTLRHTDDGWKIVHDHSSSD